MSECPACGAPLAALSSPEQELSACPECGRRLVHAETTLEPEPAANLCSNPACGTLNPPAARTCQRCAAPLGSPLGRLIGGRYRLDRRIAAGGFGVVFTASDMERGEAPVAVKEMILGEPTEAQVRLNFFRREAEILQSLQNLHIVPRYWDYFESPSQPVTEAHLVMEYIPGRDLYQVLEANANRPFPIDQVANFGGQICEVLAAMHSRTPPLIHRDIKPDNVMLLPDGSIRMIDFGTARALDDTDERNPKQAGGPQRTRIFTEGYAPPEQVVGRPEPRSDLFSLAGTLYHLATGRAPEGFFTAREIWDRLAARPGTSGPPIDPDQHWFFELLAVNLSDDPRQRHPNAGEFRRELVRMPITCRGCGSENTFSEPYCRSCARPLRGTGRTCSNCSKVNRIGARFCIACGKPLLGR